MILFHTLTADNRVLAIHQTLAEARGFAAEWNGNPSHHVMSGSRMADRIVSAERDGGAIYARSDRFKLAKALESFAL